MTAIENLKALKLQLEQKLVKHPSAEERDWIEGELMKIDIALGFLDKVNDKLSSDEVAPVNRSA